MDYITRNYDELSHAEMIYNLGIFPDGGTGKELKILAMFLRKNIIEYYGMTLAESNESYYSMKEISEEVEERLIKFCENAISGFDYYFYCTEIAKAVRQSEKYYINEQKPVPITAKEWSAIQSLESEDAKRLMFMKLIDSKYTSMNRKTIGRTEYNEHEFFVRERISKEMYCREMSIQRKNYRVANQQLHKSGFIEFKRIFQTNSMKYIEKVNIIDTATDPIDYITDFHNLLLHYERLNGGNIGECQKCGRLFRQNNGRNKYKFCEEHRASKKEKAVPQMAECVECGLFFALPARGNTSNMIRCTCCQDKINKQKKIEWMKQKRKESAAS